MNKRIFIVAGVALIVVAALFVAPNVSFRSAGDSSRNGRPVDSARASDEAGEVEDYTADLAPSTLGDEADVEPWSPGDEPLSGPRAPGSPRRT